MSSCLCRLLTNSGLRIVNIFVYRSAAVSTFYLNEHTREYLRLINRRSILFFQKNKYDCFLEFPFNVAAGEPRGGQGLSLVHILRQCTVHDLCAQGIPIRLLPIRVLRMHVAIKEQHASGQSLCWSVLSRQFEVCLHIQVHGSLVVTESDSHHLPKAYAIASRALMSSMHEHVQLGWKHLERMAARPIPDF
jgi:hypothetical protein